MVINILFAKKSKLTASLFGMLLLVVTISCGPAFDPVIPLEFKFPIEVFPEKETFNIGDTIKIITRFEKEKADNSNNTNLELSKNDFSSVVAIYNLNNQSKHLIEQNGGQNSFRIVNIKGRIIPKSDVFAELNFEETETELLIEVDLIPLNSGYFTLTFFELEDQYFNKGRIFKDESGREFEVKKKIFWVNENGVNNHHLIWENTKRTEDNWLESKEFNYYKHGTYSFKVN